MKKEDPDSKTKDYLKMRILHSYQSLMTQKIKSIKDQEKIQ